jgi:hypothetical protein
MPTETLVLRFFRLFPRSLESPLARTTQHNPDVPIRFVCGAAATPCMIALAGPVVANGPPSPGATDFAARYRERMAITRSMNV